MTEVLVFALGLRGHAEGEREAFGHCRSQAGLETVGATRCARLHAEKAVGGYGFQMLPASVLTHPAATKLLCKK